MARRPQRSPGEASVLAFRTVSQDFSTHDHSIPKYPLDVRIEDFGNKYLSSHATDRNSNDVEIEHKNIEIIESRVPDDFDEGEEIKKNVWGEVDDDNYIAERNRGRGVSEAERVKRESSDTDSESDSAEVVNSDKLRDMWDIEPPDLTECDCLGPPPEFLLPPPPRPPFLQADYYCGDDPIPDLETCDIEPKIDAYNDSMPSLQTSAAIALCSLALLLAVLVGALLVWKHKRKVTNLFPSKTTSAAAAGEAVAAAGPRGGCRARAPPAPLYEDLPDLPHRTPRRQDCEPQLEMVECKRGVVYGGGGDGGGGGRVFVCGAGGGCGAAGAAGAGTWRAGGCAGDACGAPLYEELPHRSDSDDHFAEDELSLVGEAERAATCRACPPRRAPAAPHSLPRRPQRLERRPRSLERRRAQAQQRRPPPPAEFHEGVLLDALLRLYPSVGTVGARPVPPAPPAPAAPAAPCAGGAWPGGELPGPGCWRGPRASPKPPSGDSSFGSDSGYSNNTCGTCGTRASSRHRLSAEIPMS